MPGFLLLPLQLLHLLQGGTRWRMAAADGGVGGGGGGGCG